MTVEPKVIYGTPMPGKRLTRLAKWKYDLERSAILQVVSGHDEGVELRQLAEPLRSAIFGDELAGLGSLLNTQPRRSWILR
jgi:hypothetical protein